MMIIIQVNIKQLQEIFRSFRKGAEKNMIFNEHDISVSRNKNYYSIDNKIYCNKDKDFEIELKNDGVYDIYLFLYKTDDDSYIDDAVVTEYIMRNMKPCLDKDSNEWFDKNMTDKPLIKNIDDIKHPMPSHNNILRDRKFKIGDVFGTMMIKSNKNKGDVKGMEFTNYIYENKMDEVMDFINNDCGKRMSRRTFDKHLKYIISTGYGLIGLKNTPNGLAYQLSAEIDGKYYVTIPNCQLRDLLICTNEDMLRLFIFFKDYLRDSKEDQFVTMDRGFIARSIGLSDKSCENLNNISTMVNGLARLGYIEIKTINEKYADDNGNVAYRTINSYRVRTVEEWKTINKKANGK